MDFTKNNPQLAPLFSVTFPEDTFCLVNKKMPRDLRIESAIMYEALFGKEQDPEDFTLLLKSNGGELQRIYGPSVGKDPESDNLAIKWGKEYIRINIDGTSLEGPQLPESKNWETFTLGMANFGYKDDEISLTVMLETEDGFYEVNLPLRFQDPKTSPTIAGFKTLLKKDPAKGLSLLYEVFEGVGGGSGGSSINKLSDLGEGAEIKIIDFEVYEFTSKKGEEMRRILLIDEDGNKYWSPDNVGHVIHLFKDPILTIVSLAQGKKSSYIAKGFINDGELKMAFGSDVKAMKEKTLPANDYKVWGIDSFQGRNQSFVSYVYTILPENSNQVISCFAPSKHRTILASEPVVDYEHPASFTIYTSGADDEKAFTVSQLDAFFPVSEEGIDLDDLF